MEWTIDEWLFYGGVTGLIATGVLACCAIVMFWLGGRRLKEQLQKEYGKKRP